MFKPGNGRPEGSGRKRGTPNRVSLNVIEHLESKGFSPLDKILELLPTVDSAKQMDVWIKLLSYCYPTLKAIEMTGELNNSVAVTADNVAQLCQIARQDALKQNSDEAAS